MKSGPPGKLYLYQCQDATAAALEPGPKHWWRCSCQHPCSESFPGSPVLNVPFLVPTITKQNGSIPDWLASLSLYFPTCEHELSASCNVVADVLSDTPDNGDPGSDFWAIQGRARFQKALTCGSWLLLWSVHAAQWASRPATRGCSTNWL